MKQELLDKMPGQMNLAPESSRLDAEYAKGWNECLAQVLKVLSGGEADVATIADSGQMVDIYGVPCDVQPVRTLRDGRSLGAGYDLSDPSTWFVYDREAGKTGNGVWHKHCGPYSTFDQAADWIKDIREVRGPR